MYRAGEPTVMESILIRKRKEKENQKEAERIALAGEQKAALAEKLAKFM